MDILSLIGIVLGLVAIIGGAVAKGAGLSSLWSAAAFIIVILGTLAAILVQTPMPTFRRALKIFAWIIKPPEDHGRQLLNQIVGWSTRARKDAHVGGQHTRN